MAVNFASALGGFFPGMAQGLQVAKALQELNLSGSYADDVTKASGTKGGTVTTRDQPGANTTAPAATTTASPSGQAPTTTAPAPAPVPEPAIPLNPPTTITRAPGGDYSPVPPADPGYSPAKAGGYTPIPKRPAVDIPDTRPPPTTPPPDDGQQTIQTAKNAVGGAIGAGLRYLPQVFQGATNPDLYPTP